MFDNYDFIEQGIEGVLTEKGEFKALDDFKKITKIMKNFKKYYDVYEWIVYNIVMSLVILVPILTYWFSIQYLGYINSIWIPLILFYLLWRYKVDLFKSICFHTYWVFRLIFYRKVGKKNLDRINNLLDDVVFKPKYEDDARQAFDDMAVRFLEGTSGMRYVGSHYIFCDYNCTFILDRIFE